MEQETVLGLGVVQRVPELGQTKQEQVVQVQAHGQMELGEVLIVEVAELGVPVRVQELGQLLKEREELELLLGLEQETVLGPGVVQRAPELGRTGQEQVARVRVRGKVKQEEKMMTLIMELGKAIKTIIK